MTRIEALKDLLEKVKAGEFDNEAPDRPMKFNAFADAWEVCFGLGGYTAPYRAYNGSLDAAKALDEALPTEAIMDEETAKLILFGHNGAQTWLEWKIKALIAEEREGK